jgi:2-amino-4-hydroxy-6-hydroxymethyldihydropteridine diphosphokinase
LKTVYLGLGSNLGQREANLREAVERLEAAGIRLARRSSLYETEPLELRDQPWFLNAVVEVETDLFPRQLLGCIQNIEREMGRQRVTPKGPRNIDIDLLFYGRSVIDTPELQTPHPRIAERRFVLEPLSEIAPDLRHPVNGKTAHEMLAAAKVHADGQAIRRLNITL